MSEPDKEALWKQLEVKVDLYKFFFEWVLKLDIFYYTITGAIVSFYLSRPSGAFFRFSLLLPLILSVLLGLFFAGGSRGLKEAEKDVESITDTLSLRMRFDISYLRSFSTLNAVMCFLIALALVALFVASFIPPQEVAL